MLGPLLALTLLGSTPTPRSAVIVPHAQSLAEARAFLTSASLYAPSLTPGPLGRSLGAPLALDVLDLSAWADAGLDVNGSVSMFSFSRSLAVVVVPVKDANKVLERARANLPSAGTVTEEKKGGITTLIARRPNRDASEIAGGIAIGKKSAAIWFGGNDASILKAALTAKPPNPERAKGLAGSIQVLGEGTSPSTGFALGLAPSASGMNVEGRVDTGKPLVAESPHDAFAKLAPAAALMAHGTLSPSALAISRGQAEAQLKVVVSALGIPVVPPQLDALLSQFSGPAALLITGLDPDRGAGSTDLDRYFLVSHAYAAQVKDPAKTAANLDALTALLGQLPNAPWQQTTAPVPGKHALLRVRPGRVVWFGLAGDVLYAANDANARDALLNALGTSGGSDVHGGQVVLDGVRTAQSLGHLSLLDAARSTEMAAIFALALEAGPLFKALGTSTFTVEAEPKGAKLKGALTFPAAPKPAP